MKYYESRAKMKKREAKETPKQEKSESKAYQAMENRLGVEKHCPKCGKVNCSCRG